MSGLALAYLLNQDGGLAAADTPGAACAATPIGSNPYAPKPPHFNPRAKAVISLFMSGGVSHVDTFDPKPALTRYAGQPLDGKIAGDLVVRQGHPGPLMPSPFTFSKHGQSGIEVSDLFPHVASHVDEIAFVRSLYGQSNDHVQATYEMQMGQTRMGFPSLGSWVTYGLGSESSSLPAYVVIHDARGGSSSTASASCSCSTAEWATRTSTRGTRTATSNPTIHSTRRSRTVRLPGC
jgi:hypothetical protein